MKNIKNFQDFEKMNEENRFTDFFKPDNLKKWYNKIGRALIGTATLGSSIVVEKGIDYIKDKIEENKFLEKTLFKLYYDPDLVTYANRKKITLKDRDDEELKIRNKIKNLLTEEEFNVVVKHLGKLNKELRDY